ncbi:MAG: S-layer homology domain-containing protein [Oscillospiraceae bacterium]|nr:S-layer homology domain-containing protein [Oscillospiraceae bacterium]
MSKKMVALTLKVVMLVGILLLNTVVAATNTPPAKAQVTAGDATNAVARAQTQISKTLAGGGYGKWYGNKYNGGREYTSDWCAVFVVWCYDGTSLFDFGGYNLASSSALKDGLVNNNKGQLYAPPSSYKPKAGDIIVFDWGPNKGIDHVGIVESSDASTVYTIEGNSSGVVSRRSYSRADKEIWGYVSLYLSSGWIATDGFYLKSAAAGEHTITHGAYRGAETKVSQGWIKQNYHDATKTTYAIIQNTGAVARDGSVHMTLGGSLLEIHHILQCAPVQEYSVTMPQSGGAQTVTLPKGYQYKEYGILRAVSKPDWLEVTFKQSGAGPNDSLPTASVTVASTNIARTGTILVQMQGADVGRNVSYDVAAIRVTQNGIDGTPPGPVAPNTDFNLVPAAGGDRSVELGAYSGAAVSYSQSWMTKRSEEAGKVTFAIAANPQKTARIGSANYQAGNETITLRYLQVGPPESYEVELPQDGGGKTITLPDGYQYADYGSLAGVSVPSWVDVSFSAQGGGSAVQATVSAAAASEDRTGTFSIQFGNARDGTYSIANVTIRQKGEKSPPSSGYFIDVPTDAWYFDAVYFVAERGVLQGVSPDRFAPTRVMSRAMVVTMLHRMSGLPEPEGIAGFADVGRNEWYAKAVDWATSVGVVEGFSPSRFGPDNFITREQIAVMLWRYDTMMRPGDQTRGGGTTLTSFSDGGLVSSWAWEAMSWAVSNGLMSGRASAALIPDANVNRGEMAVILQRYYQATE